MGMSNMFLGFISQLNDNYGLYKSYSELFITKLKMPDLSIRAAEKKGFLNFSSSFHYNWIWTLGELFIDGKIALKDFLFYFQSNTKIIDAMYLKREGKKIYGAKKIKNYITGSYETLQDVLFTTEQYERLLFISDFTIISGCKSDNKVEFKFRCLEIWR